MALNTGQITLSLIGDDSKVPLIPLVSRQSLTIKSNEDFYVGASNITSSNGILISSEQTFSITSSDNIYVLATTDNTVITYIESNE